ncbi:hypothetical protein IAT40_005405 [Kwoniella sp. CBS 6097]
MFNSKKRPTASSSSSSSSTTNKPFNPAHTHPASISSTPSIQTRVHTSSASGSGSGSSGAGGNGKSSSVPLEGIQSGGGGGGGAGAGSIEGIVGKGIDKETKQGQSQKETGKPGEQGTREAADAKWSDPKIVHPAWEGFGKGPKKDNEVEKGEDAKAKL